MPYPYKGAVSKYLIPASTAAKIVDSASESATEVNKPPRGAVPSASFVIERSMRGIFTNSL